MSAINETSAVTTFNPTECCPVDPCPAETNQINPAPACEPNDNRSLPHLQQLLTECLSHQQKDEALILLRDYVNNNRGDWREFLMWDEKRYTRNLVLKNEIFEMIVSTVLFFLSFFLQVVNMLHRSSAGTRDNKAQSTITMVATVSWLSWRVPQKKHITTLNA